MKLNVLYRPLYNMNENQYGICRISFPTVEISRGDLISKIKEAEEKVNFVGNERVRLKDGSWDFPSNLRKNIIAGNDEYYENGRVWEQTAAYWRSTGAPFDSHETLNASSLDDALEFYFRRR